MKTIKRISFSIFILLNSTLVFGQNKFILTGTIINRTTKLPVDSSIYVTINLEKNEFYKVYCNNDGIYSINISDSLNGKQIIIYASQDLKKINRHPSKEQGELCSFQCLDNRMYIESNKKKITLNADSTKKYKVDFNLNPIVIDLVSPTIYFKKNEVTMVQSDMYLTADTALCIVKNTMICRKNWVLEIQGHCSPKETNKDTLSLKRAELVIDKLISLGINPKRFVALGQSDKNYKENNVEIEKLKKLNGDNRPAYINKTDYEWQTVTISLLRSDFNE